jgi:hypothetical protein
MRPVVEGLAKLSEMQDCTYDLYDVALMNDALDARSENERRAHKANEARKKDR